MVTVQPVVGQVTSQPPGGQATSQDAEVWHDTEQFDAALQSTSQLGAPLQDTEQGWPASQVRLQSCSAVQTQVLLPAQVSSVPQAAVVKVQARAKNKLTMDFMAVLLETFAG